MNSSTIIGIIFALVIGGGAGYLAGKSGSNNDAQTKALQESVAMMKDQTAHIQEMAQIMQSGGTSLQEMGMKYNDNDAVSKAKDMMAIGAKYGKADTNAAANSGTMGKMMQ